MIDEQDFADHQFALRADVMIMDCAGTARYRKPLQDDLDIPVVEPTQAAVAMAIGRVRLNWAGR